MLIMFIVHIKESFNIIAKRDGMSFLGIKGSKTLQRREKNVQLESLNLETWDELLAQVYPIHVNQFPLVWMFNIGTHETLKKMLI